MIGKGGARLGAFAHDACHGRGLGQGDLGGDLVLRGAGLMLLKLKLHLVLQLGATLLARPVDLALQLGDPERLVRNEGLVVRRHGLGHGQLRGDIEVLLLCARRLALSLARLGERDLQRPLQGCGIVGKVIELRVHELMESHF